MIHTGLDRTFLSLYWSKLSNSSTGAFLYSFCQGVGGIVILLFFVSLLYTPSVLPLGLPLIVGFNSAAAGYGFVERRQKSLLSLKYQLCMIGVLLGISGAFIVVFFCPWESAITHLFLSVTASIPLTFLGAWIGVQSRNACVSRPRLRKEDK